jgi:HSP20 family protein
MTTQELAQNDGPTPAEYLTPAVEIFEDDQALFVTADLPGVEPGNVEVALEHGYLTVTGRVADPTAERAYQRRFALSDPSHFDTEHIDAVLRHGVLELRLPKAEGLKRREIPVTVN